MTRVAFSSGRNMTGRLPGSDLVIVTAYAGPHCFIVIHSQQRNPGDRTVAGFAQVSRTDMAWGFSWCMDTIVTGKTAIQDSVMIEHCRYPSGGTVTIVALITGGQV